MDIGSRIKTKRQEKNLTQKQLAEKIGIVQGMLSTYERNTVVPNGDIVVKLAQVLDTTPNWILCYDDDLDNNVELGQIEVNILKLVRDLSNEQRLHLLAIAKTFHNSYQLSSAE